MADFFDTTVYPLVTPAHDDVCGNVRHGDTPCTFTPDGLTTAAKDNITALMLSSLPLSTRVIYFSKMPGVYGDASLSDPTVGHDDSIAIRAAIDAAPEGSIYIVDGIFKCHDIMLCSGDKVFGLGGSYCPNTNMFPATGIIQSPKSQCVFRNMNWISNYHGGTPVSNFSLVVDCDIEIKDLFINGNRGTGGANNVCGANSDPETTGLTDLWASPSQLKISPLLFYGVRNLRIDNVQIYDPGVKAITLGYVDGCILRDWSVFDPKAYSNVSGVTSTDAVYITGMNNNIDIDGLSGYVSGNGINVYSDDTYATSTYYPIKYVGPVTSVHTRRMVMQGCTNNVNLSSGSAIATSLIDDITFTDVAHIAGTYFLFSYGGLGSPSGNIGRLVFDRVRFDVASGAIAFVSLGTITKELIIRELFRIPTGSSSTPPVVNLTNANSIDIVHLEDVEIDSTSSVSGFTLVSVGSSTFCGNIRIVNCAWNRSLAPSAGGNSFIISNSNVGSIEIIGLRLNNVKNAISSTGGTPVIDSITTVGITHTNAGGNPTINVPAAMTISRLRSAGSNTVQLVAGAGSFSADKKTDGTEDS